MSARSNAKRKPARTALGVERLEDRLTPAVNASWAGAAIGAAAPAGPANYTRRTP